MLREKRNKEKLESYYNRFINDGTIDPNVHPWVAASWQRCRQAHLAHEHINPSRKLNKEQMAEHLKKHANVLEYLEKLYAQTKQHLNTHNLSMLLIDSDGYVVRNYAMPFFQRSIENIQGMRVLEQDVGTSSVSVALEHNTPFLMFGPEMWTRDCHSGDACSAPIEVNGRLRYVLTIFSLDTSNLPYDLLFNYLLTLKYGIEQHLTMLERNVVNDILMNHLPAAVYCLDRDGVLRYCNKQGRDRLDGKSSLQEAFLNYEHIPVRSALNGLATIRREMSWVAQDKTYEDITSVLPIDTGSEITGSLVISMSIEDLKTTIAHAIAYSSRNSLYSMVGEEENFQAMQRRAGRLARSGRNILLQGEPGTGKQRLAHGIHQLSGRAARPLICVKCGDDEQVMREDLFGINEPNRRLQGKLELAQNGTLFLDEIERIPKDLGVDLANYLTVNRDKDIRVLSACDSTLKRLADKGLFSQELYDILATTIIRVPSLRERIDDIQLLATHILDEMCIYYSVAPRYFTKDALDLLVKTDWPGNIKQLQGVIEKAFFRTDSDRIDVGDIQLPVIDIAGKSWKYDKEVFVSALKLAGGSVSKLAHVLGVSRVTLYRYLEKFELK